MTPTNSPAVFGGGFPADIKVIVADTETTCATPERGVCEVGWVEIDKDFNVLAEVSSLIDPEKPIDPVASGIHGLTHDDVSSSPTLEEFFTLDDPACYGRKLQGPLIVVGHRIGFDTHSLGPYIEGEFYELCTLRWVRRLYPDMGNHQLSTAMYALNLPRPKDAHRVMGDIYSAMYLAQHICQRMGVDLIDLAKMSQEPFELVNVPFGKHKGTPFSKVPRSYLRWMKENMADLDQDMQYTLGLHLNKS